MKDKQQFDFWYAVNNTELIEHPKNQLETFGDTIVNYYLICEMMDSINRIKVREGQIKALKPAIIMPDALGQVDVDEFCDETQQYTDWLAENESDLNLLKYGFKIEKREIKEYVVNDPLEAVTERVRQEVLAKDNPLDAVLVGVDSPWQVCLVKLMVELVQRSAMGNIKDIRQQADNRQSSVYRKVEQAFLAAAKDETQLAALAELLKVNGLFEKYEDRFFALVR